mmetsp:Transcript_84221/g.234943  ORF Transcript_84221/g.234943 Transcript_84221/m.234943 type:complete len:426 (-) Transcript_84221:161-1438(-)
MPLLLALTLPPCVNRPQSAQGAVEVFLALPQVSPQSRVFLLLLLLAPLDLVDLRLELSLDCESVTDVATETVRRGARNLFKLHAVLQRLRLLVFDAFDLVLQILRVVEQLVLFGLGLCEQVFQLAHLLRVPHLALHETLGDDALPLLRIQPILLVPRHIELQQVDILGHLAEEPRVLGIGVILLLLQQFQGETLVLHEPGLWLRRSERGGLLRSDGRRNLPGYPADWQLASAGLRGAEASRGNVGVSAARQVTALAEGHVAQRSALPVPSQDERDGVQCVFCETVAAELAVDERVVRLNPVEQGLAAVHAQVVPAEIKVRDGTVFPQHLAKDRATFRPDLVVPQVHVRDGPVSLENIAEGSDPAFVAPHVVPLQADAHQIAARPHRMRQHDEAVCANVVAPKVDSLQQHVFAHVPRNRIASLVAH